MTTNIAYRVITRATDAAGKRIKFESFNRERAMDRAAELRASDPRSRVIGIPVVGR